MISTTLASELYGKSIITGTSIGVIARFARCTRTAASTACCRARRDRVTGHAAS